MRVVDSDFQRQFEQLVEAPACGHGDTTGSRRRGAGQVRVSGNATTPAPAYRVVADVLRGGHAGEDVEKPKRLRRLNAVRRQRRERSIRRAVPLLAVGVEAHVRIEIKQIAPPHPVQHALPAQVAEVVAASRHLEELLARDLSELQHRPQPSAATAARRGRDVPDEVDHELDSSGSSLKRSVARKGERGGGGAALVDL